MDTATIPAYITAGLRFPDDEILCRGDRWQQGCAGADGEAAYAIHTFEGKHYCGYHSPFDNKYVPCLNCGEKPALKPQPSTEGDQFCDDCRVKTKEETGPADFREEMAGHVCDEAEGRAAYGRYVSDGLADTDGWFSPMDFEAWQAHHHRAIGYKEPRKAACADTECNAPQHERTRCLNTGTRRKPRYESFCPSCYEPRAARAPQRPAV